MRKFSNVFKNVRLLAISAVFGLSIAATGVTNIVANAQVGASGCDKVNIVNCGLNGSTTNELVNSFQKFYNNGSDGRYNDLKTIYRWAGATNNSVDAMSTKNTKIGSLNRNGDVTVDGKVVATDAWVSARFGAGQKGFNKISDGVYARKTTTSFAQSTAPVLVHFDNNGNVDFAVMVDCGNAVKVTPKTQPKPPAKKPCPPKPQPKPEPKTQPKPQPKPEPKTCFDCQKLTATRVGDKDSLTFTFTAKATAQNVKVTNYTFDFGDGTSYRGTSSTVKHSYAKSGTYKASVSVTAIVNGKEQTVSSKNCATSVTIVETIKECKPGVPEGSPECKPVTTPMCTVPGKEDLPADSSECVTPKPTPPTELPNTGVGSVIGLFSATAIGGGLLHQFLLRRKNLLG